MWLGEVMRCMYTWCRTGIPGMLRRWKLIAEVHTCHDFQPQWGHRRNSAAGGLGLLSCGSTACRASLRNYQMFSVDWWPNHHVLSVNPVNHVMCYRFPVAMDSAAGLVSWSHTTLGNPIIWEALTTDGKSFKLIKGTYKLCVCKIIYIIMYTYIHICVFVYVCIKPMDYYGSFFTFFIYREKSDDAQPYILNAVTIIM